MKNRYAIPLSWSNAALTVAATMALWVAPWMLWPSVRPGAAAIARRPPSIRYVRTSDGIDGAVWSAVLFPVPTKEGFSKRAAVSDAGQDVMSLVKPWTAPAPLLEWAPDRHADVEVGVLTLKDEVAFRPEAAEAPAFPAFTNRPSGIYVEADEGLTRRKFEAPALAKAPAPADAVPWGPVTAYVETDRQGRVQHVFLDSSSGQTNIDAMIVRALLSGTAAPDAVPVRGRVRVYGWKRARDAADARE
jgi:hypothetical protein